MAQEEVFVVLTGTLTVLLGDPPERVDLPPRSVVGRPGHGAPAAERDRRGTGAVRQWGAADQRPGRVPRGRRRGPLAPGSRASVPISRRVRRQRCASAP